jgi:hypothetical protein
MNVMPERELAVLTTEPCIGADLPNQACVSLFREPTAARLVASHYVFVLTSLARLGRVAELIRRTNQRHRLRALFVHVDDGAELLPQFLAEAKLRTIRNMFVHHGMDVPRRVLNAFCIGAEHELIATAARAGRELLVVDCASDMLRIDVDEVPALRNLRSKELACFTIADDGSYLHWPAPDVHLGLEDLRVLLDPELREHAHAEKVLAHERIGAAIRYLRESRGITQKSVKGLSDRQVRRIERGEGTSVSALRKLAAAHGMSLGDYTNELARIAGEIASSGV